MGTQAYRIQQHLFKTPYDPIHVMQTTEVEITESIVDTFLKTADSAVLGLAARFGPKGIITCIALSTPSHVLYIKMTPRKKGKSNAGKQLRQTLPGREIISDRILRAIGFHKLGFDMHRIATALHHDYGLTISKAVDLQSMIVTGNRHTLATLFRILGPKDLLYEDEVHDTFQGAAFDRSELANVALRSWASGMVATFAHAEKGLSKVSTIDTQMFNTKELTLISKFVRDADRLQALKPTKVKNDVAAEFSRKSNDGVINVDLTRFKTRLRTSQTQKLLVEVVSKGRSTVATHGRTVHVEGKSARISITKAVPMNGKIRSVYTVGREEPTSLEKDRIEVVLALLQCRSNLFKLPIVRRILGLDPSQFRTNSRESSRRPVEAIIRYPTLLNPSQRSAVNLILSEDEQDRVCLIHGPPGTGKTSVIAASVLSIDGFGGKDQGVWLVAQSNVAVKNIAEKLFDVGFLDYKILVSKDFHFDWHEHLYEKIERKVIRSDDFADDRVGTERLLLGSRVILCTLSMLSHPRLVLSGFTRIVPLSTVIVDEASQIELGDYLPLLGKFGSKIRKLAFIGDDKQLAPYGQDDLGDLSSIFELAHLRKDAVFLDTQYRMPKPIGQFISRHVYGGQLKTCHSIATRQSCRLIDVAKGKEQKSGNSWTNVSEADAVVRIAKQFHEQGKTTRIITPYDAQRNLLEGRLKAASLPWENKCFNVDSFQGNEEDHIIISIVRSEKIGFLSNMRRTNVMLTRCKKSMLICTSRAFLQHKAKASLIGKLADEWGDDAWLTWQDVLAGKF